MENSDPEGEPMNYDLAASIEFNLIFIGGFVLGDGLQIGN